MQVGCATLVIVILVAAPSAAPEARPRAPELPRLAAADVPALIKQLEAPVFIDRVNAIDALGRVEPFTATRPALPRLANTAGADPDPIVRRLAVEALGRYGADPLVLKVLEAALGDNGPDVAQAAAASLPAEPAALSQLGIALRHRDAQVRLAAANKLRWFRSPSQEVLAALTRTLEDPDHFVRGAAAHGAEKLGKGNASLGPRLVKAIRVEADPLTRAFLVAALVETGGVTRADVGLLGTLAAPDPEPTTRRCAALALGKAGAGVVAVLRTVIDRDGEQLVRAAAAQALGNIGPDAKDALPTLRVMVTDRKRNNFRQAAVTALGAIDTQHRADVTATLVAPLSDIDEGVQAEALKVVQRRGAPGAAPRAALTGLHVADRSPNAKLYLETLHVLRLPAPAKLEPLDQVATFRRALEDSDDHARGYALYQMHGITVIDPSWIPGLTRALDHSDGLSRQYAAELLGRAGPAAKSAVGALARRLIDSNGHESGVAALALARIAPDDPVVLDVLAHELERGESSSAPAAANALATIGKGAVPYLIRGVRSRVPYACFVAATALAQLGPPARDSVARALQAIAPDDLTVKAALATAGRSKN